jgi:hypothetical protein
MFNETEKRLLIAALNLSITNVGNAISQLKEADQVAQSKQVLKELLALNDKIEKIDEKK